MLRAEDIRAGYGAGDIIHGISLSVAAGAVASVVGPNGSGKSTLLKALVGVLRPSSGRVLAGDRDITGLPPEEIARAGVGYVPQVDDVSRRSPSGRTWRWAATCCPAGRSARGSST